MFIENVFFILRHFSPRQILLLGSGIDKYLSPLLFHGARIDAKGWKEGVFAGLSVVYAVRKFV